MKKINRFITAVLITVSAAVGMFGPYAVAEADGNITVYITVEKLALGGGFICPPTAVEMPENATAANTLEAVLGENGYRYNGSVEDSFYVSSIRDNDTEINIPEYISDAVGELEKRWSDEWLSEFDYTKQAGWMYSVNNEAGTSSASDYILNDGDVVRWQFSIYGYGSDLGFDNTAFGLPPLKYTADKTDLIRQTADFRAMYGEAQSDKYTYAMDVLERIDSTDDEVNNAIELLGQYDPSGGSSEEEDEPFDIKTDEERKAELYTAIDTAAAYILKSVPEPQISSIGGEWAIIGLARSGKADAEYFNAYYKRVRDEVTERGGILSERKYTEYSRLVIALAALGYDPRFVGGYDIIRPLGDYKRVKLQGINGPIFALIALDSCGYDMPEDPLYEIQATREMYIEEILSHQDRNGGFSLDAGAAPGIDITAMALCALSNYRKDDKVNKAADMAIDYLRSHQLESGGFADADEESAESDAQVLTALAALDIPINDSRFVKTGQTVFDALMRFQTGSGFSHIMGEEANEMATEQALYALCAYERSISGKNRLYDMSDVKKKNTGYETVIKLRELINNGDFKNAIELIRPYLKYLKGWSGK